MIIVVKQQHDEKQLNNLIKWIKGQGLEVDISNGHHSTIPGLVGDTSKIDIDLVRSLDIVENVKRIQEPFKCANRKFHPEDTIVDICGHKFGGDNFQIIAGPCSIESEKQIIDIAKAVKEKFPRWRKNPYLKKSSLFFRTTVFFAGRNLSLAVKFLAWLKG